MSSWLNMPSTICKTFSMMLSPSCLTVSTVLYFGFLQTSFLLFWSNTLVFVLCKHRAFLQKMCALSRLENCRFESNLKVSASEHELFSWLSTSQFMFMSNFLHGQWYGSSSIFWLMIIVCLGGYLVTWTQSASFNVRVNQRSETWF